MSLFEPIFPNFLINSVAKIAKRAGRVIKSKPFVDDDDSLEITSTTVSESAVEGNPNSTDDAVCFSLIARTKALVN